MFPSNCTLTCAPSPVAVLAPPTHWPLACGPTYPVYTPLNAEQSPLTQENSEKWSLVGRQDRMCPSGLVHDQMSILPSNLLMCNWSLLSPYPHILPCLFLHKSSWSLPFPAFDLSLKYPINPGQSPNALLLHPITCPIIASQ